jgi:hypothetical protein
LGGFSQTLSWKEGSSLSIRFSPNGQNFSLFSRDSEVLQSIVPALVSGKDTLRLSSGKWKESTLDETYQTPFYRKSEVRNRCRIFVKEVRKDWSFEFRLFEDGMAYRWLYKGREKRNITHEICRFPLPDSTRMIVGYGNGRIKMIRFSRVSSRFMHWKALPRSIHPN